ncbi:MAG TPA: pentapeptide repeat-containing protein [Chitinophagaceae bacterium]|jgi:uncharacterized protein YjbI with pentapeptide repeats|nr:pentapeptide repeat-containing protein [Chitinophagaceae bacterium]
MSSNILPDKNNAGRDLTDYDLSGQDLSDYIFTTCKLQGTNFSNCTFNNKTDFTGAVFGKSAANKVTSFSGCNLTPAKFSSPAEFGKTGDKRSPSNLARATLPWALLGKTIKFVDLSGATLTGLTNDLSHYHFEGVKWNGADLTGKSLFNAEFKSCDLTGCKVSNANLEYAKFLTCNLAGVKMNRSAMVKTIFDGSTLTDTNLSYATKFTECFFLNTFLNGTIFDGNNLKDSTFGIPNRMSTDPKHITSFQFAEISTDFLMTNIQKNWQCMDLRNVIIENFRDILPGLVNLQAMHSFFNSSLSFENARLNGANFAHTVFNSVNFNNAQLNGVTFASAKTQQGKEAGYRGARFCIAETDTVNYTSFLTALTTTVPDTAKLIAIFNRFNISFKTITCTAVGTKPEWKIVNTGVTPAKEFLVVKSPLEGVPGKFELVVYESSPSTFNYAHIIGASMQECVFSNAELKHTQLFGTQIISATLSGADLTGAQLGNNAAIFSVTQNDSSIAREYSYTTFLNALNASTVDILISIFGHNGYTLGNAICRPVPPPPGKKASWQIEDNSVDPPVIFSVDLTEFLQNPGTNELKVLCKSFSAATLDNSYMPAVILTHADLTDCSAKGCHLYNNEQTGSKAILTHATLLNVNFEGANLYKADFTQAVIASAIFTKANLMNANFNGVVIEKSISGPNISFNSANLQGADFSNVRITAANFLDAAICLPISEQKKEQTYGVSLKRIFENDTDFNRCIADLGKAAGSVIGTTPLITTYSLATRLKNGKIDDDLKEALSSVKDVSLSSSATLDVVIEETTINIKDGAVEYQVIPGFDERSVVVYDVYKKASPHLVCKLPFATEFRKGPVSADVIASLAAASKNKLTLSAAAVIGDYRRPVVCNLVDKDKNKTYTVWWGVAPDIEDGTMALVIHQAFDSLPALFRNFRDMRPQSVARKIEDNLWELNMGTYDAFYQATGYIKFKIVRSTIAGISVLNFYGHTMRIMGMGNNQRPRIQDFVCEVTKLPKDSTDSKTIFPNMYTKLQNMNMNTPYEQWMWAKNNSPVPPKCVPTDYSYCPVIN